MGLLFLQDFLKYNEPRLRELPCQLFDPIPLGEGTGIGLLKGIDSKEVSEGSTLHDLVQMGVEQSHAAVGVVVRLRKELALIKDVPVLIAVDQVSTSLLFHFSSSFSLLLFYYFFSAINCDILAHLSLICCCFISVQ